MPTRRQLLIIISTLILLVVSSTFHRLMNQEGFETELDYTTEIEKKAQFESIESPLLFLEMSAEEWTQLSAEGQLVAIRNKLPEFEGHLLRNLNNVAVGLLSAEAARLRGEAEREIQEKGYQPVNPLPGSSVQLEICTESLTPVQCTLLRYAADGSLMMDQGADEGDIYRWNEGSARMQSALFAFNNIEVRKVDAGPAQLTLQNYLFLFKTVVARTPGSQTPPTMTQGPSFKGQSPVNTYMDQQGLIREEGADAE